MSKSWELKMFCQDEDEFPDLATGGSVQRSNKPESAPPQTHTQPKLPKNLVRESRLTAHRVWTFQFFLLFALYLIIFSFDMVQF